MGDTQETTDELPVARAVKFVGPDTIEGLAMPFGSYDTDRETFDKDQTDFCDEWFGKSGRPLLYDHGMDADHSAAIIGRQVEFEDREEGRWAQSQLGRNVRYRKAIDRLIEEDALGYSSGAMAHLSKKNAQGVITRWPWVELSLTPIPAHPGTLGIHYVKSADFIRRLEETDQAVPTPLKAVLAALNEWADANNDDRDTFLGPGTLDDKAGRVSAAVDEFRDHARSSASMRAKSGRVLSGANRDRIAKAVASKAAVLEAYADLEALLAETDPTSADALGAAKAALWSAVLEAQASLARGSLH